MDKKKTPRFIMLIVVIVFALMFSLSNGGIYEYHLKEKKVLTEEEIKRFEEDIKNGKKIDLSEYLIDDKRDYSNGVSDFNRGVSNKISEAFGNVLKYLFKSISNAMDD